MEGEERHHECLTPVEKAALTLSHSNAIPERGFFVNNAMLGKEMLSFGENTIVALHFFEDTPDFLGLRLVYPLQKIIQLQERLIKSIRYIWKKSDVRKQLNYIKQFSLTRN